MKAAAAQVKPADVVLDIGCGIRPQTMIEPRMFIGVDAHDEYLAVLRDRFSNTNAFFVQGEAPRCLRHFPDRSVDTVFMLDFIEHLEKEHARCAIVECERIARQQIVIFTPLGFMPQDEDAADGWALHGGQWQTHRSGWTADDFDSSWHVLACKEFHLVNGKGEPFNPPFGALWAIKTIAAESGANDRDLPAINIAMTGLKEREESALNQEIVLRNKHEYLKKRADELQAHALLLAEREKSIAARTASLKAQEDSLSARSAMLERSFAGRVQRLLRRIRGKT
jgi:hypothetical protein